MSMLLGERCGYVKHRLPVLIALKDEILMTKLEKLYELASGVKEFDLKSKEAILAEINELEEEIIKKDILPVVKERIEPALSQVKRELVLVVDYEPGKPLSVKLSRKVNFKKIGDLKELTTPDSQAEHRDGGTHKASCNRSKRTGLCITLPDGEIIQEKTAAATLVKAVEMVGPEKVRSLGIICCKVPLVSNTIDKKYGSTQVKVAPNLYVITHSNNPMKKGYLETISQAFNLGWKVEIIK